MTKNLTTESIMGDREYELTETKKAIRRSDLSTKESIAGLQAEYTRDIYAALLVIAKNLEIMNEREEKKGNPR